jgi:C-8 sterol isomerase
MGIVADLVIVIAVVLAVIMAAESNLDRLTIFDPTHLHNAAQKAIAVHGNDTRLIVDHIVGALKANATLAPFLNLKEEWIFNNAGGAMGVMYIIHASEFPPSPCALPCHHQN